MRWVRKLKEQGWSWCCRRVVRELVEPTTSLGKRIGAFSAFVYLLVDKPIDFLATFKKAKIFDDTLFFFYDFEVEPVTYDFLWALCVANIKRKILGLTYLTVVFVPGFFNGLRKESVAYEKVVDCDARRWRIQSILIPIIELLTCQKGVIFCASRSEAMIIKKSKAHFFYPDKYNVTFPVPCSLKKLPDHSGEFTAIRADTQALKYVSGWLQWKANGKRTIVITLRQYDYVPERNSNIKAWSAFAKEIKNDFFVIFIPDTEKALQEPPHELEEFCFFDQACWNISLRAAIYELAYLNLGVNTGPMSLCWLNSRCCYITFKIISQEAPQAPEWKKLMLERGFVVEENPVFSGPFQKWVWEDDSFDVILREFNSMCSMLSVEEIKR